MSRLALVLFAMVAVSLMGTLVTASLAMGYDTRTPIIISAVVGFVLAIPASYYIANKISDITQAK